VWHQVCDNCNIVQWHVVVGVANRAAVGRELAV
jgi:hypothetical protein